MGINEPKITINYLLEEMQKLFVQSGASIWCYEYNEQAEDAIIIRKPEPFSIKILDQCSEQSKLAFIFGREKYIRKWTARNRGYQEYTLKLFSRIGEVPHDDQGVWDYAGKVICGILLGSPESFESREVGATLKSIYKNENPDDMKKDAEEFVKTIKRFIQYDLLTRKKEIDIAIEKELSKWVNKLLPIRRTIALKYEDSCKLLWCIFYYLYQTFPLGTTRRDESVDNNRKNNAKHVKEVIKDILGQYDDSKSNDKAATGSDEKRDSAPKDNKGSKLIKNATEKQPDSPSVGFNDSEKEFLNLIVTIANEMHNDNDESKNRNQLFTLVNIMLTQYSNEDFIKHSRVILEDWVGKLSQEQIDYILLRIKEDEKFRNQFVRAILLSYLLRYNPDFYFDNTIWSQYSETKKMVNAVINDTGTSL